MVFDQPYGVWKFIGLFFRATSGSRSFHKSIQEISILPIQYDCCLPSSIKRTRLKPISHFPSFFLTSLTHFSHLEPNDMSDVAFVADSCIFLRPCLPPFYLSARLQITTSYGVMLILSRRHLFTSGASHSLVCLFFVQLT